MNPDRPTDQLLDSEVGRVAVDACLLPVESTLTTIAMRRHRGERVSDQAETVAVIRAALGALLAAEVDCPTCGGDDEDAARYYAEFGILTECCDPDCTAGRVRLLSLLEREVCGG